MLLCPQCQFENPNTNKFCQRCGTSLTHKTCDECGAQVPINAENCHKCGAFTGTVWLAIISKDSDSLDTAISPQALPLESSQLIAPSDIPVEESQIEVNEDVQESLISHPQTPTTTTVVSAADADFSLIPEEEKEATISPESTATPKAEPVDEDETPAQSPPDRSTFPENTNEDQHNGGVSSSTVIYLDSQQRYRLLEPQNLQQIKTDESTFYGASARVLDCQPFQKSLLEVLTEQQQFDPQMTEEKTSEEIIDDVSTSRKILGIPGLAQPYLALHQSYYPTLPEVHDAWQQDGEQVVLLEDRSEWQLLSDLWGSEQLSTLQILYWLDEMAKLWEALEPWHYRQSLLEISNLRVDEDQALSLVRLYPEAKEQKLTLQDLGQMWQTLFSQSQRTQFTALVGVFRQMCMDEIKSINQVRSQFEEIAREHQSPRLYEPDVERTMIPEEKIEANQKSPMPETISGSESDLDIPTIILPMQLMSLDDAGCTDIGHQREHNEDCFGIYTQIKKQEIPLGRSVQARGLYIICDGMGGHAAGEVASAMAVEKLKSYFSENWHDNFPTEETVREGVRVANQAIYDVNQQNARSGSGRMGTTLVMILIQNTEAVVAHVGDSRLYRLTRKQGLEQITVDHEVGQREIARGVDPKDAYERHDAYQLTQALGPRNEQFINPDVQFLELNEDTLFVLCSDGLSDNDLIETHWQTHLNPLLSARANLDQGILQLIDLANEQNGHDNITTILIRVKVRPNFEQQQLV